MKQTEKSVVIVGTVSELRKLWMTTYVTLNVTVMLVKSRGGYLTLLL